MRRIYFICVFFIMINSINVSALEKAIINDNHVNVRDSTNISSSKVLYQLNAGDEILIYYTVGDGKYANGIYNLWYNISREKNEYINAMYVSKFPFENRYIVNDFDGTYTFYQFITDYKKENGKLYFYGDFFGPNGSPIGLRIWQEAKQINWIGNRSKNISTFNEEIISKLNEQFLLTPTSEEIHSYGKRIVKTYFFKSDAIEAVIEIGGLAEKQMKLLIVYDEKILLPFGITVGMAAKELESIFGKSDQSVEGEIIYRIGYGFIITILFKIENDKISQIKFSTAI